MESFSRYVSLLYPHISVVPGQEWIGNRSKYKFICDKHGEYESKATHLLTLKYGTRCKKCSDEKTKARNDAITAAFVGQITDSGCLILEHIGYHQPPSFAKRGYVGTAKYRFQCPACGNTEAQAQGCALKQGDTTHCGCLSKRDSRLKFSRNQKAADAPCFVYLFNTIGGCGMKLGIAKDIKRRASESYEEELFAISMTRAEAWSVEQVMLHRLRKIGLTFDLSDVPAWNGKEGGGSEVFAHIPPQLDYQSTSDAKR